MTETLQETLDRLEPIVKMLADVENTPGWAGLMLMIQKELDASQSAAMRLAMNGNPILPEAQARMLKHQGEAKALGFVLSLPARISREVADTRKRIEKQAKIDERRKTWQANSP